MELRRHSGITVYRHTHRPFPWSLGKAMEHGEPSRALCCTTTVCVNTGTSPEDIYDIYCTDLTLSWDLLTLASYPTPLSKSHEQQGMFHVPALSQTLSHPSFVLKLSAGCTVPALYPGAGAEIVTAISGTKNLRSCCSKEKTPTCLLRKMAE